MGNAQRKSSDPFDFPSSIVPEGMTYQWVGRTLLGDPHPDYQRMLEAGWSPVPGHRHRNVFKTFDVDGNVCVGGLVLMSRLEEISAEARELDHDAAYRNAQASSRLVKYGDVPVHLSWDEIEAAASIGISCQQYALRRMKHIAEGFDRHTIICGQYDPDLPNLGALVFRPLRRPRHRWLRWLFDLISTETT